VTDFSTWSQATLAKLAHDLMEENKRLREDNKTLLEAWRQLVKERA